MVRDPGKYMDSLALSYNHLPLHLRQCFVFVGVFPEDYDIPVTKLIWLWIAQGFIHETESGTLEDVAEDFLMDLIKRSLLIPGKRRVNGHIKTCRIHDLLRDLCLKKADEENFSQKVCKHDHATAFLDETIDSIMLLSPEPPALSLLSDFCYPSEFGKFLRNGQSFDIERYESLRILDVESISVSMFPAEVTQLLNLRYLAIQARDGSPSASISSLVNLQMLIIASRKNIVVPKTIWGMVNLRHPCIKTGENHIEDPCFVHETKNDSLQTLSQVSPQSCHNIFSRTPNLRKLGICGPLVSSQGELEFPNIRALQHLQKLKLLNTIPYGKPTRLLNTMMFPETLKNLTLSNTCMGWEDMWALSLLPNLEVLKLKFHACIGKRGRQTMQWVCWRENFPGLKRLVVRQCLYLESIPSELGKINTLEAIEVWWCRYSTQVSALKIQEEQESEGNFFLKVHATNNY
ncbi:putative leucine-rich repeat domain superfamily, winged helix-like DNA-binding domain superfamily [Helianthus anomalus]